MEPAEKRKVSLMQALATIRNEKVAIRKEAAQRRKQVSAGDARVSARVSSLVVTIQQHMARFFLLWRLVGSLWGETRCYRRRDLTVWAHACFLFISPEKIRSSSHRTWRAVAVPWSSALLFPRRATTFRVWALSSKLFAIHQSRILRHYYNSSAVFRTCPSIFSHASYRGWSAMTIVP